jgi:membrane protein YqaA with SNARE-associated domain
VKALLVSAYYVLARFGGVGLFVLGILDSSFLFMPLGNDLLVLGLTAQHHSRMLYYAAMSTVGSTIGAWLVDLVSRKGGEEGLGRFLPPKRIEYVKKRISNNAGKALALASIMPPPFPFTPFVIGAAAFQYPRNRLLAVVTVARMARFTLIGLLAIWYGNGILRIAQYPGVQYGMIGFIALCVVGSIISIVGWIKRSKSSRGGAPA